MKRSLREIVWERAEGRSDLSGRALRPDEWECHHRRPGRQGGTRLADQHTPANALALAPGEHNMRPDSVHMAPTWAKRRGLLLPSGQGAASVPRLVPVWWRGRTWVYLTEDGRVVEVADPSVGGTKTGAGDLSTPQGDNWRHHPG